MPARVANHSYIESIGVVFAFDFLTATDDLINVDAVGNDFNTDSLGLPAAFNGISVGRSDGHHLTGTDSLNSIYTGGRTAPLLVAPADATSYAAPQVSGIAASLVKWR